MFDAPDRLSDHRSAIGETQNSFSAGLSMNAIPHDAKIIFDRRSEERIDQTQRTILAEVDGRKYLFELHNLSSMGASGRCDAPLAVGDKLTMIFEGWREAPGTVRCNRHGLLRVEFGGRLSPDLLNPASQTGSLEHLEWY